MIIALGKTVITTISLSGKEITGAQRAEYMNTYINQVKYQFLHDFNEERVLLKAITHLFFHDKGL